MDKTAKAIFERGTEILNLAIRLQSEKDGVCRPLVGEFNKTKQLDALSSDADAVSTHLALMMQLSVQAERLSALGKRLEAAGEISLQWGDSYSQAALTYLEGLANHKIEASNR